MISLIIQSLYRRRTFFYKQTKHSCSKINDKSMLKFIFSPIVKPMLPYYFYVQYRLHKMLGVMRIQRLITRYRQEIKDKDPWVEISNDGAQGNHEIMTQPA